MTVSTAARQPTSLAAVLVSALLGLTLATGAASAHAVDTTVAGHDHRADVRDPFAARHAVRDQMRKL